MTSVTACVAAVLRQGHALFLRPGPQRLEASHTVIGWAKDHPGNLVIADPQGRRSVIFQDSQVYVPTDVLL